MVELAQPDEVANYNTGDGIEKAFTLANILRQHQPDREITIMIDPNRVVIKSKEEYEFSTTKDLKQQISICPAGIETG